MKKKILLLILGSCALSVFAQEEPANSDNAVQAIPVEVKKEAPPIPSEDQSRSFKKRHLKLMEKALNEIGVTEEQREKIFVLQDEHMEKMRESLIRLNKARCTLSDLQEKEASIEELETAIQELSNAQKEQLRILVMNRREMELILGKEKNDLLMQKAQEYFKNHGRRPGEGMPPRPGSDNGAGAPPPPVPEQTIPPLP